MNTRVENNAIDQNFSIYHFLPLTKWKVFRRLYHKINAHNVNIVLDLEDSCDDVFDRQNTTTMKREARQGLVQLARSEILLSTASNIWVRINDLNTEFFQLDLETMSTVNALGAKLNLMIPKVSSPQSVDDCLSTLAPLTTPSTRLALIIETTEGVDNLEKILTRCPRSNTLIVFGLFDYLLNAHIWPFWRHDSTSLWEMITHLIAVVEAHHFNYIHTAFPELENDRLLADIKSMLLYLCRFPCGMVSLSQRQTEVLRQPRSPSELTMIPDECEIENAIQRAHEMVEHFTRARCNDRSFSLADQGRRFIPPHEYQAAMDFLNQT